MYEEKLNTDQRFSTILYYFDNFQYFIHRSYNCCTINYTINLLYIVSGKEIIIS